MCWCSMQEEVSVLLLLAVFVLALVVERITKYNLPNNAEHSSVLKVNILTIQISTSRIFSVIAKQIDIPCCTCSFENAKTKNMSSPWAV